MQEDELPSWLLRDTEEVEQMAFEENEERLFGLGKICVSLLFRVCMNIKNILSFNMITFCVGGLL